MTTEPQIDERIAFLREGSADALLSLLGEIVTPMPVGMSAAFFMLGMDPRFRKTHPEELFDLITAILRERVPRTPETQP